MKNTLIALLTLIAMPSLACNPADYDGLSKEMKFIKVVDNSDFAFIGKVLRLYRLPDTPPKIKDFNGYVFEITETIAGTQYTHMEAERSPTCGVNTEDDIDYWPQEIGKEYVITGVKKGDYYLIKAVLPVDESLDILYDVAETARRNAKLKAAAKSK